ncbi:hypothetical protein [Sulfobacillus sp. hq2]|uniref:hypothetical protein n=1 Tax=Sulfobacillus TaxID=28033 RepID=UPI000CD020C6|nr:hypothetical protein [Sulfobacillus sp. hq2]POB11425.1 hypothetical protein CO251_04590 [Sulfobacillus sp. hq2]
MSDITLFPVGSQAVASPPKQIGSASYTDLTASSTYQLVMVGVLNRSARARSFIVENSTNEAFESVTFIPFDSTYDALNNTAGGQSYEDSGGIAASGYGQYTSEMTDAQVLAAHFDSLIVEVAIGATAPTSGDLTVAVVELFS